MKINSRLSSLLNVKFPIIQGGMAWVSTAELAAAVSEAGGLGVIAAGNMPPDGLRTQIESIRRLTDKPYGVNVMLLSPFASDIVSVVLEYSVPVVTTGAGNPGRYVDEMKAKGMKVIPVVPSVALARRMERAGVDALIAEGQESGGHISDVSTLPLVPQIVDAVNIPVIAAGGIADGRGIVAAFALGAEGVQIGTRFICSTECTAHENYKQALIKAADRDTVVTGRSTGHPVRVLVNRLTREFDRAEAKGASSEELDALGRGALRKAVVDGDVKFGSVMAGQGVGMVKRIESVEDIIKSLMSEANMALIDINSKFFV